MLVNFTDLTLLSVDDSGLHPVFMLPIGYFPSEEKEFEGKSRYHYLFFSPAGDEPELVSYSVPYFDSIAYTRALNALRGDDVG